MTPYAVRPEHAGFHHAINRRPKDATSRGVYADWLEENEPGADRNVLDLLRSGQPSWVSLSPEGEVLAGRHWTMPEIKAAAQSAGSHWFDRSSMRFFGTKLLPRHVYSGPGGVYFVHQGDNFDRSAREYNVASFHPKTGETGSWSTLHADPANGREFASVGALPHLDDAASLAHALSLGTPQYPKNRYWNEEEHGAAVNAPRPRPFVGPPAPEPPLDPNFTDEFGNPVQASRYADDPPDPYPWMNDFQRDQYRELQSVVGSPPSFAGRVTSQGSDQVFAPHFRAVPAATLKNVRKWSKERGHELNVIPERQRGYYQIGVFLHPQTLDERFQQHVGGEAETQPDQQVTPEDWYALSRYSADESGLPAMLSHISPQLWRGWPHAEHAPYFDLTPRLVAADYLQDLGRDQEAGLLRDTRKHLYLDAHGQINDAHELSRRLNSAVSPLREALAYPDQRQYLDTALWASTDDDGHSLDENYGPGDIHPNTLAAMIADMTHFHATQLPRFEQTNASESDLGHDFWLSRNGHGSGFFDKPNAYGEHADDLQDAAEGHGEFNLTPDSHGQLHGDYEVLPNPDPPPTPASRYSAMDYAKVPASEEGVLTPEQLAIAQQAMATGDMTGWGALGDHLADNGYPNAGGVLSLVGIREPGSNIEPPRAPHRLPEGGFRYAVFRDGADLLHRLAMRLPGQGYGVTFTHRQRPEPPTPASRYQAVHYADPLDPAEQAAFEARIDENPLDPLNHGVYADWLQDRGHDDEAAFRRSLGTWLGEHDIRHLPSTGVTVAMHPNKYMNSFEVAHHEPMPWRIYGHYGAIFPHGNKGHTVLPEGVEVPDYWHNEPGQPGDTLVHDMSGTLGALGGTTVSAVLPPPAHVAEWRPGNGGSMRWRNYRGMEEGLRRSFLSRRQHQQPPPEDVQPTQASLYAAEASDFESAIDANPLDWQNHLVYADWLQENAQTPEQQAEAEFRREMGKWVAEERPVATFDQERPEPWLWASQIRHLPDFVQKHWEGVPAYNLPGISGGDWGRIGGWGAVGWNQYRDMENGFRQAFEARRQAPEQLSRYERRNSPLGFDYNDRSYRKGQFIPGTVLFQHNPPPRSGTGTDGRWRPEAQPEDVQPTEYAEVSEDEFHRMLDQNPEDHQTRLILADYLQEHDDPRAEGYRALGILSRTPEHYGTQRRWWGKKEPLESPGQLPSDWRIALGQQFGNGATYPSRQHAEDAAALAFSQLPPERRQEILNPPGSWPEDVQPT